MWCPSLDGVWNVRRLSRLGLTLCPTSAPVAGGKTLRRGGVSSCGLDDNNEDEDDKGVGDPIVEDAVVGATTAGRDSTGSS